MMHQTENISKQRDCWFDNAKAILIILVVLAHLAENLVTYTSFPNGSPPWLKTLYEGIYIFHMPVFIIISGRFAKRRIDSNDWPSVTNKLIVPYLILQTTMMLFRSFLGYASASSFTYISPMFGVWYIITIAVYQLITPHFRKVKGFFLISIAVAIMVQFGLAEPKDGFMRLFTYYPFFLFGYLTADRPLSFCKRPWFRVISVLAFAALFALVRTKVAYFPVGALTMKRVYSGVLKFLPGLTRIEFLIYTLCHYTAGVLFFFFLMGICPAKKRSITCLGTQSNYIYVLHLFVVIFLRVLDKKFGFLDLFHTDLRALIHVLCAIPLSFILVSPPVKKAFCWLVSPRFDIKKLMQTLMEGDSQ